VLAPARYVAVVVAAVDRARLVIQVEMGILLPRRSSYFASFVQLSAEVVGARFASDARQTTSSAGSSDGPAAALVLSAAAGRSTGASRCVCLRGQTALIFFVLVVVPQSELPAAEAGEKIAAKTFRPTSKFDFELVRNRYGFGDSGFSRQQQQQQQQQQLPSQASFSQPLFGATGGGGGLRFLPAVYRRSMVANPYQELMAQGGYLPASEKKIPISFRPKLESRISIGSFMSPALANRLYGYGNKAKAPSAGAAPQTIAIQQPANRMLKAKGGKKKAIKGLRKFKQAKKGILKGRLTNRMGGAKGAKWGKKARVTSNRWGWAGQASQGSGPVAAGPPPAAPPLALPPAAAPASNPGSRSQPLPNGGGGAGLVGADDGGSAGEPEDGDGENDALEGAEDSVGVADGEDDAGGGLDDIDRNKGGEEAEGEDEHEGDDVGGDEEIDEEGVDDDGVQEEEGGDEGDLDTRKTSKYRKKGQKRKKKKKNGAKRNRMLVAAVPAIVKKAKNAPSDVQVPVMKDVGPKAVPPPMAAAVAPMTNQQLIPVQLVNAAPQTAGGSAKVVAPAQAAGPTLYLTGLNAGGQPQQPMLVAAPATLPKGKTNKLPLKATKGAQPLLLVQAPPTSAKAHKTKKIIVKAKVTPAPDAFTVSGTLDPGGETKKARGVDMEGKDG